MSDSLELEQDVEAEEESGEELTPEQKQAQELEEARTRLKKFEAFAPFVEKLEADPSRVFDVRAALDGTRPQESPAAPAAPPQNAQLNQAQLKELNDKLKAAALDPDADFLGFVAGISGEITKAQLAEFQKNNKPYLESASQSFVDRFKSRWEKGSQDPELYSKAEKIFDEEMSKVNPADLLALEPQRRDYELTLRKDAAVGKVVASGYQPTKGSTSRSVAASASRGTTISQRRGAPEKVVELTDHEKNVLIRQLGDAEGKKAIDDIEAGR